jgi:hypothetical protein
VLVATDGAADLAGLGLPLATFWSDDRCFANPDMVRRRLAVLGRNQPGGGLPDDTTLVVARGREA